ncbi:hypothetical protein WMF04_29610 [Sorangium sp. So ce260]|uniref:hypothetical protein n=1 Tax=Sorangium sp. So ce260 TaxID=3133291 RepID=UPI003F5FC0CA
MRLLTPRAFGGHELSLDAFADVTMEIARADGSSGWCFSFLNIHSWLLATFPVEAQRDVWLENPDAALANVNVPAGKVVREEGGYRLSGDWPWASGIHHCDWAMLAGVVPPEPGAEGGARGDQLRRGGRELRAHGARAAAESEGPAGLTASSRRLPGCCRGLPDQG